MQLSSDGLKFIKWWEGCKLKPYIDADGHLTVGYGHLITPNNIEAYRNGITMLTAENLLRQDVQFAVNQVNYLCESILPLLSQQQFDMLVSFVFNVGVTQFIRGSVLKDLKAKKFSDATTTMLLYCHDKFGKVIDGLKKRRQMEVKVFNGSAIAVLLGYRRQIIK